MSFDRLARPYRWLETAVFGTTLQRSRTHWIATLPPPKSALILGEGDGRFLCELVRAYPDAEIDCIDASPRMLQRARDRLDRSLSGGSKNVRFLERDIASWAPPHPYDLVVTHFFLDCFPRDDVERIVEKLARVARPGDAWLLSDFTQPAEGWERPAARALLSVMYRFFRITTGIRASALIDPAPYLERNGLVCTLRRTFYAGMVRSDLWQRRRPSTS